ncbi:MAG: FAD-dependent thymidylate synthase [Synergistaceae bacterium]|nr:FAD-dependent thymidylate synthase [Synergistaceae bacterium]
MEVKLLTSPASMKDMEKFTALAALICHANAGNMNKEGYKPSDTLRNIIKLKHESILEHINLTYSVKGLSRACLQELARHRHISLSVESTRHTLREQLLETGIEHYPVRSIMVKVLGMDKEINLFDELFAVLGNIAEDNPEMSNDELKYYVPEFWPTNLILTANIRELRHILKLRTAPAALKEFRVLAYSLYEAVPIEYRYLLTDCVYRELHPLSEGKEKENDN